LLLISQLTNLSRMFMYISAGILVALKCTDFILLLTQRSRNWGSCYVTEHQVTSLILSDIFQMILILGFLHAFYVVKDVTEKKYPGSRRSLREYF
jgi:hypothetical protein